MEITGNYFQSYYNFPFSKSGFDVKILSSPKNKIFIRILNILILQIGLIGDIVVEIKSQQLQISL